MTTTPDYRSYNNFSTQAIYTADGEPSGNAGWTGWQDEFTDNESSTPITSENLNAMLNMLIYIRNVIGKTTDFAQSINGVDLYKTKTGEDGKTIEDILNSVYPNPDNLDNRSIAKYLETAFNAIIGEDDNTANTSITRTLAGLKAYLESLDVSATGDDLEEINKSGTSKWINKLTQTDGKITAEYSQPDASDIAYTKESQGTNLESVEDVDDALDKLDETIGDLDSVKFDGDTTTSTIDNLIEIIQKVINDRIAADTELKNSIDKEIEDRKGAINDLDFTCENTDPSKTVHIITQLDGKITQVATQDIKIESSQVSNFEDAVKAIEVPNAEHANEATKAAQDSSGNDIVNTYATKAELSSYETAHSNDYTNLQIDNLIAANKPELDSNGGIIEGDSGLKLDDTYLKYLKKMTFATPSIAKFSLDPSITDLEVGQTFTLTSISHQESNTGSISGTLTLKRDSTTLKSEIAPANSAATIKIEDSVTLETNGSVAYTLSGSYTDSEDKLQTISSSKSINWYWPHFYGASSNASLTDVSGLSKSLVTVSNFTGTLKIPNTADQYVYFVSIDDSLTVKSGGFDVPLTRSTVTLNINGVSKSYNVYRTNQLNAGTLTYVLS